MWRILPKFCLLAIVLVISGCLHAPMPWSPDGRWIAYVVEVRPLDGWLTSGWILEPATAKPVVSASARAQPKGYRLWATRADSGESVLLADSKYPLTAPGWSPDGRALAFGRVVVDGDDRARFEVVILDSPGRERVLSARPLGVLSADTARLPGQAIVWSPDGHYLAIPQLNPLGMAIIRSDTGRQINAINDAYLPSWSPDGSRLAFYLKGTGDTLNCLDKPTAQPRVLAEVGQAGQAPAWTRDGATLVVAARRSSPRGADQPGGDFIEMLKVRVDSGQTETLRALSSEPMNVRDRAVEGVSIAFDGDGENLFAATVIDGSPHQIVWYHPRENEIYKRFVLLDYSVPMSSLSLAPDGRTLAARIGPIARLSPPALCDLDSPDLRSRLIAPDDESRIEWIATLVGTARGILASIQHTANINGATGGRLERLTMLPVAGEIEANSEQVPRLRRIGRLGRPLCDRPTSAGPASPEVAGILDEARVFFDYLSENYAAAFDGLETLEDRAGTSEQRYRLLCLRAQILLARGDVDRADETIRYLSKLDRSPGRRIEWNGSNYVVTGSEPTIGRGWPTYLGWRASALRVKLHEEGPDDHENPDAPKINFGLDLINPRPNQVFPNDPFLPNPNEPQFLINRPGPIFKPAAPAGEVGKAVPRL